MRRFPLALAGLLAAWAGPALEGQDLATAAARERERRAAQRGSARSPVPTLSDRPSAQPWVAFEHPGGEFRVELPAAPAASEEALQFEGRFVTRQRWSARSGTAEYWVARAEYPPEVLQSRDGVERILSSLREELRYELGQASVAVPAGVAGQVGWRIDVPATCHESAAASPSSDRRMICAAARVHVFLSGRRVYLAGQTQRGPTPAEDTDEAYFQSFRLAAAR